jgi:NADH-quinone oxidoreductase subunit I
MNSLKKYFQEIYFGFSTLSSGLKLTLMNFTRPWKTIITEEYPEYREVTTDPYNRKKKLYIPERFAGEVILPHDENNEHKCTACKLCELACPNGTITISTKMEADAEGNEKKVLDKWGYNLGMCTFCAQCIEACPQDAIIMKNNFELSVYNKNRLEKTLNNPGSKLKDKKK